MASQDRLNSMEFVSRSGKFLVVFVSTVILGSGSCRTADHIFLCHDSGVVRVELVSSLVMSNEDVECGPLQFRLFDVLILRERRSDFIAE